MSSANSLGNLFTPKIEGKITRSQQDPPRRRPAPDPNDILLLAPKLAYASAMHRETLTVQTRGKGLYELTGDLVRIAREAGIAEGVCHVFVLHTSASLVIHENADPSATRDLVDYFERVAPENHPAYTHTAEGPDDMPSHIRAALTRTSETLLIGGGRLLLGTWQGVFLFEHRRQPHTRRIEVGVVGS